MSAAPAALLPAFKLAEGAVNRVLALDPSAQARLQPLIGKVLAVELEGVPLPLQVSFLAEGVKLESAAAEGADARLRSSPGALLGLALRRGEVRSGDLEFRGDVGVVQAVQRLFAQLDVDWEEHLSRITGDVAAHQLGNLARGAFGWLRHAGRTAEQDLGEYLTEERQLIPPAAELSGFLSDVDRLREDVDRLAARIGRLERGRGS